MLKNIINHPLSLLFLAVTHFLNFSTVGKVFLGSLVVYTIHYVLFYKEEVHVYIHLSINRLFRYDSNILRREKTKRNEERKKYVRREVLK